MENPARGKRVLTSAMLITSAALISHSLRSELRERYSRKAGPGKFKSLSRRSRPSRFTWESVHPNHPSTRRSPFEREFLRRCQIPNTDLVLVMGNKVSGKSTRSLSTSTKRQDIIRRQLKPNNQTRITS